MMIFFGAVIGVILIPFLIASFFLIAPLFKESFTNDPEYPHLLALFTKVESEHAKIKMRGGKVVGILRGDDGVPTKPENASFLEYWWWRYEVYVHENFGLYVIGIPPYQEIYTYSLPRYRVVEVDGKKDFRVVEKDKPGYTSDHLRNGWSTWYFQFSGAEVDTIPVTVKGSVQMRVRTGMEKKAVFGSDSWNVLLDQALNSVIRGVMRSQVKLAEIIGEASTELFTDTGAPSDVYEKVRELFQTGIAEYTVESKDDEGRTVFSDLGTLAGLEIGRVDVIDFEPDLGKDELNKLMAPLFSRQAGRARDLEGQAEAAYQRRVLAVLQEHPALARENVWAEAFVKATKNGTVDALLAAFLKQQTKGN